MLKPPRFYALFLSTLPARGATADLFTTGFRDLFLSTLPARGATPALAVASMALAISIHAPREGSDLPVPPDWPVQASNFYPRSPRGERLKLQHFNADVLNFYPRSPRGERP